MLKIFILNIKDLFDDFFVFKALDELTPEKSTDFNNFKDVIVDKYNNNGYLIFRKDQYIFQPIDKNEDIPMRYRIKYSKKIQNKLSLFDFLHNISDKNDKNDKNILSDENKNSTNDTIIFKDNVDIYDFNSTLDYYDNRKEFKYVGIIDKEVTRKKNKRVEDIKDVFKIREKRGKVLDKKRGTGIPSLKGAVCFTSKDRQYLTDIAKLVGVNTDKSQTRSSICDLIREKMLELEKYGTEKDKNKLTYVIIPFNHPKHPFPYNLEDRVEYIVNKLKEKIRFKINIKIDKKGDKKPEYFIEIKCSNNIEEYNSLIKGIGGTIKNNVINVIVK